MALTLYVELYHIRRTYYFIPVLYTDVITTCAFVLCSDLLLDRVVPSACPLRLHTIDWMSGTESPAPPASDTSSTICYSLFSSGGGDTSGGGDGEGDEEAPQQYYRYLCANLQVMHYAGLGTCSLSPSLLSPPLSQALVIPISALSYIRFINTGTLGGIKSRKLAVNWVHDLKIVFMF